MIYSIPLCNLMYAFVISTLATPANPPKSGTPALLTKPFFHKKCEKSNDCTNSPRYPSGNELSPLLGILPSTKVQWLYKTSTHDDDLAAKLYKLHIARPMEATKNNLQKIEKKTTATENNDVGDKFKTKTSKYNNKWRHWHFLRRI